jgi:DNA topoisomerase-1
MEDKKTLVVVESPVKAKTINRYLGNEYIVKSSMGHLIDLPKSRLGVDVDNGFEPDYITIRGRGKILKELKREAQRSRKVFLAADSDREGEAISFHIKNSIKKSNPAADVQRIVFNEITADAIHDAVLRPRDIDMTLVQAQKARRVLDRLVGYNLSPLLWEKIKKGLSAGRVQSVALKVICEREEEIERFVTQSYWTIEALFEKSNKQFRARLIQYNKKKVDITRESEADEILGKLKSDRFVVIKVEEKERRRKSPAPFTTSKLQQSAGSKLKFSARKTMMVAQQLYEGIALDRGPVGLITYMRTDSVRISKQALDEVRQFIDEQYKKNYLPASPNMYKNRSSAQDAHEAIRPTSVFRTPEVVKPYLTRDQYKLYKLIWEHFVASQLPPAVFIQTTVDIQSNGGILRANGQKLRFDGFLKVLKSESDDKRKVLPDLETGEVLDPIAVEKEIHFTEPPARYTDATLVKFLEESGIGRPSTYAPIISTLIKRYYIERKNRQFVPTFLGRLTSGLLVESFPDLLNIEFTAKMESKLDDIEDGKMKWNQLLKEFYAPFIASVEHAKQKLDDYKGITDEETDYVCEKCGRKMMKKLGRYGFFLACSGFPECRNARPLPLGKCPRKGCDGFVVERRTKSKRVFYGCSKYPECDFMTWDKPVDESCPRCGSIMAVKKLDGESFLVCLRDECGYRVPVDEKKGIQLVH